MELQTYSRIAGVCWNSYGSSLVHSAGQSLGPGGRRLRTVDSGSAGLFGDDDEEGGDSKRRVKRELGAEGDLDELDFEETFADDEEKMDADDKEDEEAKELEVRYVTRIICDAVIDVIAAGTTQTRIQERE